MSLLEDVFLEDEAGEAQELERVIEGDEYDERPAPDSDENSEKEDEAEEDKRRVDPTSAKPKRIVKNPRVILNPARLTGPRGIQILPEHFKDFNFKGKGHEKDDLDLVLKKLEHWAYRLFPKFEFKDCLKKMETLGNKRPVMVHLTKIRTDQFISEETVVQKDSSDDEAPGVPQALEEDEFDRLLQQQIELARSLPAPGSARKGPPGLATPVVDKSLMMPKATSSPSISEEQKQRMLRNRQLAEERRLARLKLNHSANNNNDNTHENSTNSNSEENTSNNIIPISNISPEKDVETKTIETSTAMMEDTEENIAKAKSNRSCVIDSSDSDNDDLVINEAVQVDIHNSRNDDSLIDSKEENNPENKNRDEETYNSIGEISDITQNETTEDTIPAKVIESANDIEMNESCTEIGSTIELRSKSPNFDQLAEASETVNDPQNLSQNGKEPESSHSNCETKISESVSPIEESTKKTEASKLDKEIEMEDIMDVDFNDDF